MGIRKVKIFKYEDLLDSKFDLPIENYFLLPESDKDLITRILDDIIMEKIQSDPIGLIRYERILMADIKDAEKMDDFERCEILKRLLKIIRIRIRREKNRRII